MKKQLILFVVAASLATAPLCSIGAAMEHGGTPMTEMPGKRVTAGEVKNAIKEHVKAASRANSGVFVVKDDKLGKEWRLKLDKVHDPARQFEKDGETVYFACTDFTSTEGADLLDIDFWMVEKGGKLEVIDTKIHKVNGEPRFTYEGTEIKEVR